MSYSSAVSQMLFYLVYQAWIINIITSYNKYWILCTLQSTPYVFTLQFIKKTFSPEDTSQSLALATVLKAYSHL